MFKPQQASQQTPQRFFTLEVQLTASKGTTANSQPRISIIRRKGAFPSSTKGLQGLQNKAFSAHKNRLIHGGKNKLVIVLA
jgi:hypothetical protein